MPPDPTNEYYAALQQRAEEERIAASNPRSRYARKNRIVARLLSTLREKSFKELVNMSHQTEMELFANTVLDLLDEEGEQMLPQRRP